MCGRFPNALDANRHAAAINDWLSRAHRGARPSGAPGKRQGRQDEHRGGRGAGQTSSSDGDVDAVSASAEEPAPSVTPSADLDGGYHPTTNLAPTSFSPVLYRPESNSKTRAANHQTLLLEPMRWGLLPASTKTVPKGQDVIRTINARSDTILSGRGLWDSPFKRGKRCVVWTQGFYEWQATPQARLPHLIGMPHLGLGRRAADGKEREMMPMAGLWEECTLEDGKRLRSFAICTTEINKQLEWLVWLGVVEAPLSDVAALMRPYAGHLDCYRVPQEVGRTGTDDAKFLLPIEQRKDGIAQAFGRVKKRNADGDVQGVDQTSDLQDRNAKRIKKDQDRILKSEAEKAGPSAPNRRDAIVRERGVASTAVPLVKQEEQSMLQAAEQAEKDAEELEAAAQEETEHESKGVKLEQQQFIDLEQIEADRKLAQELQRSEERADAHVSPRAEFGRPHEQRERPASVGPSLKGAQRSSKFSPEPWNPPLDEPVGKSNIDKAPPSSPTKLESMLASQKSSPTSRPGIPVSPSLKTKQSHSGSPKSKVKDASATGTSDIRSFFKQ